MSKFELKISKADSLPLVPADATRNAPLPRDILSSIGETIYDWDIMSDMIAWGPNAADVLPVFNIADLQSGRTYAGLMSWDSRATRLEAINKVIENDTGAGARYYAEYGILLDPESRSSPRVWIEDSGRCFAGPDGKPAHAHGAVRVVAKNREELRNSQPGADLDSLTGAMSRASLMECLNRLFVDSKPGKAGFAMLLLAIDGMTSANRTYGYDAGDAIIAAAVQRIRETMRGSDIVARYSGNSFAILLQNCDTEQIEFSASRFLDALTSQELKTPHGQHKISVRAGGICAPRDARNTQQLFQHAEEAIDTTRGQSKRFILFTPSLKVNHERLRNQAIAEHILDALNQRRVAIALQPIVAAKSGKPVFYEALLRLRTDDGREISPASLIPVAEKSGLVTLLDQRVMELAIDRLAADPALTLTINISGITAHDSDWLEAARTRLNLNPGVASRLIAEITETCAIGNIDKMRERIAAIRETGMRIAMDDFGAGYSSFKNLRGLGIDLLKIDGAFIQNLARSSDDRFFVRTLIELANHLQIPVVAEWVENQETATLLAEWGVDYCQGSWFGMGVTELAPATAAGITAAA